MSSIRTSLAGQLSETANLAYGLRPGDERLRPQPPREQQRGAQEASTVIQAAARSSAARKDATRSSQWLEDLTRHGKLDSRTLGELGGGKRSVPSPLLGVANRSDAVEAAQRRAEQDKLRTRLKSNPGASGRPAKAALPEFGVRRPGGPPGRPASAGGRSRSGSSSGGSTDRFLGETPFRKANREFVQSAILGPLVERACRQGEALLAARHRQAEFERRPLPKPVCVASLFGTQKVSGDVHSGLAFVEQVRRTALLLALP